MDLSEVKMRRLAVEYIENEGLLYYSIMDVKKDSSNYIDTGYSKNIKSKYHAARETERLYDKYSCTKFIVEDDLIEYIKYIDENREDGLICEEIIDKLDPIQVIQKLIDEKTWLMTTFGEDYIAYAEVLRDQVFEPNGYKLTVEPIK